MRACYKTGRKVHRSLQSRVIPMFLIRTLFWLGIVVMLLPSDAKNQAKIYATATSLAQSAATFCDRHDVICKHGAEQWAGFKTKLEFAGRMAFDIAAEHLTGHPREAVAAAPQPGHPVEPTRDTLAPADRAPAWRGKGRLGA